ncbi:MAG: tetratricopeptide repeat protein [Terriglobia bacterium]
MPGLMRAAVAWGCVLSGLCLSIGATRAIAAPQQNASPASKPKANPAAKSAADSAEFKKLAARATEAREQDRLQEAAGLYEKALKLNPRWQEGWWYLGTLDYDANNYGDGVKAFRNLVGLNRENVPALALLGLCEFETHDYGNAFVHLQMAKSRDQALNDELYHVVQFHLALLNILHGDFEAANALLYYLVHHDVLSQDVKMALGLTLLRVPLLPDQVDPGKDAVVSEAGRTGEFLALEDYNEADEAFQQLIRDYPTTPFVHYAYASMLAGLSRFEKAEEQGREEIKINPESAMPYMLLARIDVHLNRFQDALPWAQEAVKLAPQVSWAHYLLGRALLATGKVTDAVDELATAKRLGPGNPEFRYNLALALAKAKRPREAAAEQAEFLRLSALAQSQRSGGASDVKNSSRTSSAPGEFEPDQLPSPPARDPHQ